MEFKMEIEPKSKWIHIELPFQNEKKDELVLLPESFKPAEDEYKAASVIKDPEQEYKYGDVVVVPSHIIREIKIEGNVFNLVERNHIMALLK
tara:strand:+ start:1953 stop:2228 length:276 start_codon:yes stop_codon:yes gene_type:complete